MALATGLGEPILVVGSVGKEWSAGAGARSSSVTQKADLLTPVGSGFFDDAGSRAAPIGLTNTQSR